MHTVGFFSSLVLFSFVAQRPMLEEGNAPIRPAEDPILSGLSAWSQLAYTRLLACDMDSDGVLSL